MLGVGVKVTEEMVWKAQEATMEKRIADLEIALKKNFIELGKMARGVETTEKYKFGDNTRGIGYKMQLRKACNLLKTELASFRKARERFNNL